MNKKPVLFRIIFYSFIILVFAWSMYPLRQQDFYKTFEKMVSKPDKQFEDVIALAKDKQLKDKSMYSSSAVLDAAAELGVDLTKYVSIKNTTSNKDVISAVRKQAASSIRLGIDLNGGAEFLLELQPKEESQEDKEARKDSKADFDQYRDAAIEIIRNRLGNEKIYELEISPVGDRYISLKVPLVNKEEKLRLLNLIKMSAKLQFALVAKDNDRLVSEYQADPKNFKCPIELRMMEMTDLSPGEKPKKRIYFINRRQEMDGRDIATAFPSIDQYGQRFISLSFNNRGTTHFGKVTEENTGRQLAIILDGTLYSAPVIREPILGGHAQITGSFSDEEARQISTALISGNLPVNIMVQAVFDIDPTLGKEEVQTGIKSGIVATVATVLFMLIYYLRSGVVAGVALMANIVLVLGAMAAFEATLTLPGIAGIILTIGMAVDANVLINERIREELDNSKTLPSAIEAGYDRAFITILDSNLTTLMTALILMWQGTGPIKGFAVTLSIGILTSMFTAIYVTRLIYDLMLRYTQIKSLKMMRFFSRPNFDFLGTSKYWISISVLLVVLSIGGMIWKGRQGFSIDFTGGTRVTYSYVASVPAGDIAKELEAKGYTVKVTYKSNMLETEESKKLEIVVRDRDISKSDKAGSKNISPKEDIEDILTKKFPQMKIGGGEETSIGGLIGLQFTKSAIIALVLSIMGMIAYLALRFELSYGVAANIALLHDVVVAAGLYVLCGGELSLNVIAALLTIMGYSVNDTIVIFDRIRENLTLVKNRNYKDIINLSVNQTLSRTILTSFTVFLVLIIMLAMGGTTIRDFCTVMLVGVIVGTYSSVFIASPIVSVWHKKSQADSM